MDELVRDLFRKDGLLRDAQTGRSDQAEVTKRILQGQDVVALLPTGAGKSLPYMLAGLLLPGMTLYVGPLVSLLQDQAERLRTLGISHVEYLSSALDHRARQEALNLVQSQGVRFLLVSPERFLTVPFLTALKNRQLTGGDISQVVVDECHCVSEWGHEFRPAYLSLGRIAKDRSVRFGTSAPLVGLTGTASTIVLSDVLRELGIKDSNACVRAANLDRPELTFHSTPVFAPNQRAQQIEQAVRDALQRYAGATDGILVFCPFRRGRSMGVFSVTADLTEKLPGIDVRFFCGGDEPWQDYAVFALRRRRAQLTRADVQGVVPAWARTVDGARPWADLKALVQRDYISGAKRNYRVLVATKAFGMGIDKPSIRKVIHAVAPTSPEAFYQEIGRAARDRQPADAELLFCDANPAVTNQILDPGQDYRHAADIYNAFRAQNAYGGGDFLRTFFFHNKAFQGPDIAAMDVFEVARLLHQAASRNEPLCVPFALLEDPQADGSAVEYSIVRLMHLGVVDGYTKDYNKNVFNVEATKQWWSARAAPTDAQKIADLAGLVASCFATFIRRYRLQGGTDEAEKIQQQKTLKDLYTVAAGCMMRFTYDHLERQRRRATRDMLEIARIGVGSADEMRQRLLNYLQVSLRYTGILETMEPDASPTEWINILKQAVSPQDLAELHGATQRVLGSYPTHPGLLFLSGVSRPMHTPDDQQRSEEEFMACVQQSRAQSLDLSEVLMAFLWFKDAGFLQRPELRRAVMRSAGLLQLEVGGTTTDLAQYLVMDDVRTQFLSNRIRAAVDSAALQEV